MYVCIHTYIHTYIHTHTYKHRHGHGHGHGHGHTHRCIHIYMHTYTHTHIRARGSYLRKARWTTHQPQQHGSAPPWHSLVRLPLYWQSTFDFLKACRYTLSLYTLLTTVTLLWSVCLCPCYTSDASRMVCLPLYFMFTHTHRQTHTHTWPHWPQCVGFLAPASRGSGTHSIQSSPPSTHRKTTPNASPPPHPRPPLSLLLPTPRPLGP